MENVEYFIVITKVGLEEPVVLPERYDDLEIARNCSRSLTKFSYNDCTIKLMEDNGSKVSSIESFNGSLIRG